VRSIPGSTPPAPTLFPVLSVLVSLLGSLILVMAGVTSFALGPGRTVSISVRGPSDTSHRKTPTYLEWDGQGLTVHPERVVVPLDLGRTTLTEAEMAEVVRAAPDDPDADVAAVYWGRVDAKFDALLSGTRVAEVLAETQARPAARYLVLLVRPSGFDSFIPLRNFLLRRGIDVGYEPIEQRYAVRVQ
jgi:hypothetical protein